MPEMQVKAQSRAYFTTMKNSYYFQMSKDMEHYEDKSTDGEMYLSCLIGTTLSDLMRDSYCPLELIRINRGCGMTIIARRRFNDIKVEIYE